MENTIREQLFADVYAAAFKARIENDTALIDAAEAANKSLRDFDKVFSEEISIEGMGEEDEYGRLLINAEVTKLTQERTALEIERLNILSILASIGQTHDRSEYLTAEAKYLEAQVKEKTLKIESLCGL